MSWWEYQLVGNAFVELDRIDATAGLRAEPEAIPFQAQKACLVHGPFIPCDANCPRNPATYTMKRDQKRGAHLQRDERGRMVMRFNFKRPHGVCCGLRFTPGCQHPATEKLNFANGEIESVCVRCGTRVA